MYLLLRSSTTDNPDVYIDIMANICLIFMYSNRILFVKGHHKMTDNADPAINKQEQSAAERLREPLKMLLTEFRKIDEERKAEDDDLGVEGDEIYNAIRDLGRKVQQLERADNERTQELRPAAKGVSALLAIAGLFCLLSTTSSKLPDEKNNTEETNAPVEQHQTFEPVGR